MKNKFKILGVLLCASLCLGGLFGCAGTTPTTTAPTTTAATTTAIVTPAPAATTAAATATPAAATASAAKAGEYVSYTLSIRCDAAVAAGYDIASQVSQKGTILPPLTAAAAQGSTALEVLREACDAQKLPLVVEGSGSMAYVGGINALVSGDCGGMSGWMFSVNGEFPTVSCGDYAVQEGDVIAFLYTVDGGPDVGLVFE